MARPRKEKLGPGRFKGRRTVEFSARVPDKGIPKLWGFGYADLSDLLGVPEAELRMDVHRKKLDPLDLRQVAARWARSTGWKPPYIPEE